MQLLFKCLIALGCAVLIVVFKTMPATASDQQTSPTISGSILINLLNVGEFFEFTLHNGNLLKTSEGKNVPNPKEKRYDDCSDHFKEVYWPNHLYHYEKEEKLAAIMSQYDLQNLDDIRKRFVLSKGNLGKERYILTGPGRKFKYFWGKYADHFKPNKQFSYVIYYEPYPSTGVLLDLKTNQISFPFGTDRVENIVWHEEGRYVAYSAPNIVDVWDREGRVILSTKQNEQDSSLSILFIKDISTGKTLLRKGIAKYVDDITWSPDSSAVALLTFTDKISKSPGDLIPALAGHPYFIKTFYLEIYDLSGNLLYNRKIEGTYRVYRGHDRGRLVWIP